MTNEQKKQVRDALVRYAANFETQTSAALSLEGISPSTISQIKNDNWELLSDRLWSDVARQVGFYCADWQPADTSVNLLLRILFSDAQHYAMTYGIAIGGGLGKTFSAIRYVRENENAYYLACNGEFNRKSFICALTRVLGFEAKGGVPAIMQQVTDFMVEKEEAILILDDAHKLKDRVLHLIVLLANSFAGKTGIIILGCEELRTRIIEGVRLKKVGFDDIFKSIGRRFITLGNLGPKDVELVCKANGVHDEDVISYIEEASAGNLHSTTELIMQRSELRAAA